MAEPKWVQFKIEMFNDPKLKIINSMEERDLISYVWIRSILLAGRSNKDGCLYINDTMPYKLKTLAIEFDRTLDEIKLAFKVLRKLEMIELTEGKVFKVKNWAKHQNIDGLEKIKKQNCERVARHRAKKKEQEEKKNENTISSNELKDSSSDTKSLEGKSEEITNVRYSHNSNYDDENYSNVTCNGELKESNITVMEENKKEIENKIKKDRESNRDNDYMSVNIIESVSDEDRTLHKGDDKVADTNNSALNLAATKLLQHYEQVTGLSGGLDIGSLRLAIMDHGELNVRKAIDEAIETGKSKSNMRYINGILKNWKKEGYPEDNSGGMNNVSKPNGKGSTAYSNEFKGIKPKKCRELTEEERKNIESNLI